MEKRWDLITTLADKNGGYLTTKQAEERGISRATLSGYTGVGKLIRVARGRYIVAEMMADEFALLQSRCSHAVFSHGTALYFWGLSDRIPHTLDLTVSQGTNVTRVKRDNPQARFHYVGAEQLGLGKSEMVSPQGATITLYDKERCICDLIRARKHTDMQIYTQAIKDYFAHGADTRKLLKYAKKLGIEDKVRTYMEVLL